jgi:hypothetical protein
MLGEVQEQMTRGAVNPKSRETGRGNKMTVGRRTKSASELGVRSVGSSTDVYFKHRFIPAAPSLQK